MSSRSLPLDTKFRLGREITDEQLAFLDEHGFLHFEGALAREEVGSLTSAIDALEQRWLDEGRRKVFGIPLFHGRRPDGSRGIQRLAFSSIFSDGIARIVRDSRFDPVRRLISADARVGEDEKDGVVVNRFVNVPGSVYPRLGWHTDGLRDLFYLRMPGPMLNVGLHLDDCPPENGGLRLLPGTHKQGFLAMCFSKPYFLWHRPDPREVVVATKAGDLTVHDGRLWHRVARSTRTGATSLRRTMYVPYLAGPRAAKSETSGTPLYHHAARVLRRVSGVLRAPAAMLAVLATVLALVPKHACGAAHWGLDRGVANFGRGGADIASPGDPVALALNPAGLASLTGVQVLADVNATSDHRRFERAPDAIATHYAAAQNHQPVSPSPGLFASWNLANVGVPRVTLGLGLYGPPRADAAYDSSGAQRYSIVGSHNLQVQQALGVAVAVPELRSRVGVTGMLIDQTISMSQDFNTFMGTPEARGYDAEANINATDRSIPTAIAGVSVDPIPRLTAGASYQFPYDVRADGRMHADLGPDLAQQAHVAGSRVRVRFWMPPIARAALRGRSASGRSDLEFAFVWEGWSRARATVFTPHNVYLDTNDGLALALPTVSSPTHFRDTGSLRLGGSTRITDSVLLRAGTFVERSAISRDWISAANFDLDKLGVTSGARIDRRHAWLDFALGGSYWIPATSTNSNVVIPDPVHHTTAWCIGNGRYSNWRITAMAALGVRI